MSDMVHKFTLAGLGEAPFKLVAIHEMPSPALAAHNPMAYNAQLAALPKGLGCGSCHYCGTGIKYNFELRSADGKSSVVGSDCIRKAGDDGLIKKVALIERAKRQAKAAAKREVARQEYIAKREKERADAKAAAEANRPAFDEAFTALRANNDPIIEVLGAKSGTSQFCHDMVRALCGFQATMTLPKRPSELAPRAREIVCDIYAKAAGRAGSAAYKAAVADFETRL